MPVLNVESLDDPLLFDATGSFSGGMDSNSAPRILSEFASSELINVDIDRTGTAETRRGTKSLSLNAVPEGTAMVQGMSYFNTLNYDQMVICKNRKIFYFESAVGEGGWQQEGSSYLVSSDDDVVHFAQLEDKLFFCDGTSALKYFDGTSVQSVNAGSGAPSGIRLLASHTNRLFAVPAGEPDTIYVSDLLDAEGTSSWSVVQSLRIGGDGDPITAIHPWTGFRLLAFKRNSTFVINADPTATTIADWAIETIDRSVGCIAPRSVAQVGADIYWLASDGVRSLRRTLAGTEQEVSDALSKPIENVIQELNVDAAPKAAGFYYLNRYIVSFPTGNSSINNTTVVFNTDFKVWSGKWDGIKGQCWARYSSPTSDVLCLGTSNGKLLRWTGNIPDIEVVSADYQDDGQPIATSIKTREYTFRDVVSLKSLYGVELEFLQSEAVASVDIIYDGGGDETIFTNIQTTDPLVEIPFIMSGTITLGGNSTKRRGRDLSGRRPIRGVQARIRSSAGKLSLRSVVFSAFLESYQPQVL